MVIYAYKKIKTIFYNFHISIKQHYSNTPNSYIEYRDYVTNSINSDTAEILIRRKFAV